MLDDTFQEPNKDELNVAETVLLLGIVDDLYMRDAVSFKRMVGVGKAVAFDSNKKVLVIRLVVSVLEVRFVAVVMLTDLVTLWAVVFGQVNDEDKSEVRSLSAIVNSDAVLSPTGQSQPEGMDVNGELVVHG